MGFVYLALIAAVALVAAVAFLAVRNTRELQLVHVAVERQSSTVDRFAKLVRENQEFLDGVAARAGVDVETTSIPAPAPALVAEKRVRETVDPSWDRLTRQVLRQIHGSSSASAHVVVAYKPGPSAGKVVVPAARSREAIEVVAWLANTDAPGALGGWVLSERDWLRISQEAAPPTGTVQRRRSTGGGMAHRVATAG